MKILQTISGFDTKFGGTSTCTYDLVSSLNAQTCNVDLLTLNVRHDTDKLMGSGESWIKALPYDAISSYGYSKNIKRFLLEKEYDLYHTNGMWMYCNHITANIAKKKVSLILLLLMECYIHKLWCVRRGKRN